MQASDRRCAIENHGRSGPYRSLHLRGGAGGTGEQGGYSFPIDKITVGGEHRPRSKIVLNMLKNASQRVHRVMVVMRPVEGPCVCSKVLNKILLSLLG